MADSDLRQAAASGVPAAATNNSKDAVMATKSVVKLSNGKSCILSNDKQKAAGSIDSGFGAWDTSGKFLYFGHACWLLKEIFWLMLIPYAGLFVGTVSLVLIATSLIRRWDGGISGKLFKEAPAENLIGLTHITWLFWNLFNMAITFFYTAPEETPSYAEGMVNLLDCDWTGSCKDTFDTLMTINRVGFALVFAVWLGSCIYLLYLWIKPPRFVAQGHAFQTVFLEGGWIAFWVAKDFAWTYDEDGFEAALVCYCIHFCFLVVGLLSSSSETLLWDGLSQEEIEKLGATMTKLDLPMLSYVLWSLSSLLWFLMEEKYDEDLTMRWMAVLLCTIALVLFGTGFNQVRQRGVLVDTHFRKLQEEDAAAGGQPIQVGSASGP